MTAASPLPPGPPAAPPVDLRADPQLWLVMAVIVAAVALRIALADYPFWFDEYASLIFAREPLAHLWGPWMVRETNPPLFYTLAKGWHGLVGDSFVALRLLPIFGAACSMALLAVIARRSYGPRAVLPVLVLYAISCSAIFISHQFRGYIFCEVGVLIALVGLVEILHERGPPLRNHALYVAGSAIAIYSHTTLLLWPVVASLALVGWFACFRRPALARVTLRLLAANLCLLALSGWVLWMAVEQLRSGAPNIRWFRSLDLRTYSLLVTQNAMLAFYPSIGHAAYAGLHPGKRLVELALALGTLATLRQRPTQFLAPLLALGAALLWLAQLIHPVASDRTVHWLSLPVLLLIGGGMAQIKRPLYRGLALAIPAAGLLANLAGQHDKLVIEDFTGPLRGMDPRRAVVITEHASDALVFRQGCRMAYHLPECPARTIALASSQTADSWASGMLGQPLVTPAAARAMIGADQSVFIYRHGPRDPLALLGLMPRGTRSHLLMRGPFTPDQIRGLRPLPPEF